MYLLLLLMNIYILLIGQEQPPSLFISSGITYFSELDLAGPNISLDLQFPINDLFALNAGIETSNAHSIDYIGGEEGIYLINFNSINSSISIIPIHDKNNFEVNIGGLFHYTGYSQFLYKDVRKLDNDQIIQIREYLASGRRKFSYQLSAKYFYFKEKYKYGVEIQYINYAQILSCSFLFGFSL